MLNIQSERLQLLPLSYDQLLLMQKDFKALEQSLGLQPSHLKVDAAFATEMQAAMQNFCLPNTKLYPDLYVWYTNWQIILKETNAIIGNIGFSGYPDDYGITRIGYMISVQHQHLGYASEALHCLLNWGFSFSVLKAVNADTTDNNVASKKVLTKTGFKLIDQIDDTLYYRIDKKDL